MLRSKIDGHLRYTSKAHTEKHIRTEFEGFFLGQNMFDNQKQTEPVPSTKATWETQADFQSNQVRLLVELSSF